MQFVQTNREELQDFAGIIFIRILARGSVFLVVLQHIQIASHRRTQGRIFQQLPEIAECVAVQNLKIRSEPARVSLSNVNAGHNEDLVQRKSDALPQLVLSV